MSWFENNLYCTRESRKARYYKCSNLVMGTDATEAKFNSGYRLNHVTLSSVIYSQLVEFIAAKMMATFMGKGPIPEYESWWLHVISLFKDSKCVDAWYEDPDVHSWWEGKRTSSLSHIHTFTLFSFRFSHHPHRIPSPFFQPVINFCAKVANFLCTQKWTEWSIS